MWWDLKPCKSSLLRCGCKLSPFFCGSEGVVHELTVTTRIVHVAVHELLFAQKLQVLVAPAKSTLPTALHCRETHNGMRARRWCGAVELVEDALVLQHLD